MSKLIIHGGKKLSGTHYTPGNKNAALPMITATLLTTENVTLENLPIIEDVIVTLNLMEALGATVDLDRKNKRVTINTANLKTSELPQDLCRKVRSSILFAGPLVARTGSVKIYPPGGDVIGRRRIDTHVSGLEALGAKIEITDSYNFSAASRLTGTYILLDEQSVTATENIIMASVTAKGCTILYNVACEPHVQDICRMLVLMGAKISGIGTNKLCIEGVDSLHGTTARIGSDYIDAGSYMVAALVTGGELIVENISADDFAIIEKPFKKFGVKWTIEGTTLTLPGGQKLQTEYDLGDAIPKIEDGPWPAFPSDLMSILIVLATQSQGTTLFFEKMFESRMYFIDHLIGMGARIVQCDPHRVVITGPAQLNGNVVTSPDIRAGISLLIAALVAKGKTTILNANSIDRGYESVELQLAALGADIVRED